MPQTLIQDGPGTNTTIVEQQQSLLAQIQILKFTATPSTVQPFQDTTVSYQVKLPAALKTPLTFTVNQKSLGHAVEGSGTFPITANTTFNLYAATNLTGRVIASTNVAMNTAQCRMGSIAGAIIAAALKSNIDGSFAGRLTGTGSTVTLGAGTISIAIPVNLNGEGSMTLDVGLGVAQSGESVAVTDNSVTVQIHLNTILNAGSWCSNAMQTVVQPFMQHIVDNEIVPAISQQLTQQINGLIQTAEQSTGPVHRTFALTTFALNSDGATFTVCPTMPVAIGAETQARL